jgi:hypothetical protein
MNLSKLIEAIDGKLKITHAVKHPEKLLVAMKELNGMIGMTKLKDSIAKQVMYLIKNAPIAVATGPAKGHDTKVPEAKSTDTKATDNKATGKVTSSKATKRSGSEMATPAAKRSNTTSIIEVKIPKAAATPVIKIPIHTTNSFDMLNTVLYGPPGTGKTRVGMILCKIWLAIGCLKPNAKDASPPAQLDSFDSAMFISENSLITYDIYMKLENLSHKMRVFRNTLHLNFNLTEEWKAINEKLDQIRNTNTNLCNKNQDFITKNNIIDILKDPPPEDKKPPKSTDDTFVVVSREDFVAKYVGHSALKTLKLLNDNLGKVVFIDEAYSLIHGDRDIFGMEALTTLNLFMSQHPHDIIIIFAGYKNLMQEGIFTSQPGLQRRCTWVHEIEAYTPEELLQIFRFQLKEVGQEIDVTENDILNFFKTNKDKFPGFGGDTKRLIFYAKLEHASESFEKSMLDESYVPNKTLSIGNIEAGLKMLNANQSMSMEESRVSESMMYI